MYLDVDERRRFAVTGHEFLIEQVQYYGDTGVEQEYKQVVLDFNHPTKEIIWAMRNSNYTTGKMFLVYSNKEDWTDAILEASRMVLYQSMLLLKGPTYIIDSAGVRVRDPTKPGDPPPDFGLWEEFEPQATTISSTGNFTVINNSLTQSLWININSLVIGDYSITNKIYANLSVNVQNVASVDQVLSGMLDRDISFDLSLITDTRLDTVNADVCVYQFTNYGLFITGKWNPLSYAMLEYNGENRVDKRNGRFFGDLQPYIHHSSTPKNGINLYSFAIEPENHQPTGTSNLSKIENIIFTTWISDTSNPDGTLPTFPLYNLANRLYIYAYSYNIFRVISGLTGLSYSG